MSETMVDLQATPRGAKFLFEPYRLLSEDELRERIRAAKKKLGSRLLILGHHYQKDEVIEFADLRGDSYRLSAEAAKSVGAEFLIFCGVHFMAETADILTAESVQVILPDMSAGCSMADMADIDQVDACWDDLERISGNQDVTPITYVNSTAALKAFCGKNGGTVCTSSNAGPILEWAFRQRERVLFFPDQHLGRNTAKKLGIPLDRMVVWDPREPLGGNSEADLRNAKVILWRGWCSVHQMFKTEHVQFFRKHHPQATVLVHPECMMEVVDQADLVGSTEYIIETVRKAPAGSQWAIGTELHLVNRLKAERPDCSVSFLSTMVCMCATMYRIDLPHLAWVIENLAEGVVVNRVQVPSEIRRLSRIALEKMLQLSTKRVD